jgi:hypothetical protein
MDVMKLLSWLMGGVMVMGAACGTDDVATTASGTTTGSGGGSGGSAGGGGSGPSSTSTGMGGCPPVSCENAFPDGIAKLEAFEDCLYCRACFDACAGDPGICPNGGMEEGCSMGGDCTSCAASQCAWYYDGFDYTGVCAMEYQACDSSEACLALKDCRANCNNG